MTREPEPDRITRLIELATQLLHEVDELTQGSGDQLVSLARRARSNRRLIMLVMAGFALDVILTVTMAVGLLQVTRNADKISKLAGELQVSQTTTRQRALCPLYQIFLDSKSDQGRAAAADPKKYDHAFGVIQKGYDTLDCATFNQDPDAVPPQLPTR